MRLVARWERVVVREMIVPEDGKSGRTAAMVVSVVVGVV